MLVIALSSGARSCTTGFHIQKGTVSHIDYGVRRLKGGLTHDSYKTIGRLGSSLIGARTVSGKGVEDMKVEDWLATHF